MYSRLLHGVLESRIQIHPRIGLQKLEDVWNDNSFGTYYQVLLLLKSRSILRNILNEQNPESFDHRIIFMFLLNDIGWRKKVNTETCLHSAKDVAAYAAQFKPRQWCFVGPASENTWWNEKLQRTSKKMIYCRIADGTRYFQRQLRKEGRNYHFQ